MLRYGKNQELKNATNYLTPGAEDLIEVKENLRDLGVQMADDAKFSEHINNVCSKVRQKCGWILRTFNCRKTHFLKLMWKTLVQGKIDYCSQLYFPNQSADLEKLEQLQKTFTKKIPEAQHMNYWERLKFLKMYSQQRRAERYQIIYTWKVLEGRVPNCGLNFANNDRRGRECSIPPLKGSKSVRNLRDQSFQVRGPRLFNALPRNIRNTTKVPVEEFKEKLDNFLSLLPDKPKVGDLVPNVCDQVNVKPSNSVIDVINHMKTNYGGG